MPIKKRGALPDAPNQHKPSATVRHQLGDVFDNMGSAAQALQAPRVRRRYYPGTRAVIAAPAARSRRAGGAAA